MVDVSNKINVGDLDWNEYKRKQLGAATDGSALGCSLVKLPPDEASAPGSHPDESMFQRTLQADAKVE